MEFIATVPLLMAVIGGVGYALTEGRVAEIFRAIMWAGCIGCAMVYGGVTKHVG